MFEGTGVMKNRDREVMQSEKHYRKEVYSKYWCAVPEWKTGLSRKRGRERRRRRRRAAYVTETATDSRSTSGKANRPCALCYPAP